MWFTPSQSHRVYPIEVRRRKGTRHLRLKLGYQNQIIASVPWNCGERETVRFIEQHRAWLEKQLRTVPATIALSEWLQTHPRLSGSGDQFSVQIIPKDSLRATYSFDRGGADILLKIPRHSTDPEAALLRLVRSFAKDALHCRTAYQARRLGLRFNKLSVRDQASRWGSCSSSSGISLNWRLTIVEPVLQDYVILHELAHLTEMNHSPRFWKLLESYDPERQANEAALDAITPKIMRVGR